MWDLASLWGRCYFGFIMQVSFSAVNVYCVCYMTRNNNTFSALLFRRLFQEAENLTLLAIFADVKKHF